ncbi:hypothetical protein B7R21_06410 [Subtercola boreus]|uniref:Uncharacterized protein n=1 Tax=Subtercola boreus TaxID=120213 RepID=A0A3E0VZ54_9MICO|nr:hypothetical protein [Subtercola boreus]RFA14573.1 hypothetical protein B7R21_06410 [Subtercola boreus]
MSENQENYTIKAAAARVGKSTRTIERWVRHGMRCRDVAGIVVIEHSDLMAQYRIKILANPNRQKRGIQ